MAEEPLALLLDYLITDFQDNCSFIVDPNNVEIGESFSFVDLGEEAYPRIEMLIREWRGNDFNTGRTLEQAFRLDIRGILRREQLYVGKQDMFDLIRFGREVFSRIYTIHTAKMAGTFTEVGFEKIQGFPVAHYDYETQPGYSMFKMLVEFEYGLPDDYTNN